MNVNKLKVVYESVNIRLGKIPMAAAEIVNYTIDLFESIKAKPCEIRRKHLQKQDETSSVVRSGIRGPRDPAVPIEDSIHDDYIICLEDGGRYKMLKRHLRDAYGMTPDEYRNKWHLPSDYPMTCTSYRLYQSPVAKQLGWGTHEC